MYSPAAMAPAISPAITVSRNVAWLAMAAATLISKLAVETIRVHDTLVANRKRVGVLSPN
jgi:hypothetical protein